MIALLLGCAAPGGWPAAPDVFHGVVTALGPADRAAYEAAAPPVAPAFTTLDADADGHLSEDEVAAYVLATDPTTFDPALMMPAVATGVPPGAPPGSPPGVPPGAPPGGPLDPPPPGPPPARKVAAPAPSHLLEALRFEAAAIHARAPDAPLPTDAELEQAARLGATSPDCRAALSRLRDAAERAGLTWPTSLGG